MPEDVAADRVAIAEEMGRRGVVREGVHNLLGGPGGGGVLGHVEVEDAPAIGGQDNEDEEDVQVSGGNGEEVDRPEVADMVDKERAPGLRRGYEALREQARDGALGDIDPKLQEFAMNSGGTPDGIGRSTTCPPDGVLAKDRRAQTPILSERTYLGQIQPAPLGLGKQPTDCGRSCFGSHSTTSGNSAVKAMVMKNTM